MGKRGKSLAVFLFDKLVKKEGDINKTNNKKQINYNQKRIWLMSSAVIMIGVVFIAVDSAHAQIAPETSKLIMNWAIAGIAKLIVWIAEALGLVLIFLIDLLINIVQYNNFVKATPVQIGWPLIRDTVNMFFIVVVLVSAFATIIGYPKEFRYREVLPKLLLMAVLINFSKTLIGLMIDFSQVVLLTFVNGFKQAAGGNFVQALGIAKIMRLTDTTGTIEETNGEIKINIEGAGNASAWSLLNIVVAAVFAIWIISISITLILIMLIFFLGRIIMLWFLLITSPIAFFAWSLPGSLKKALSSFTDEWWSRLSNALIGGPTMAFFLWLSLAMAQRQSDLIGPGGLYNPDAASSEVTNLTKEKGDDFIWPTQFGDPRVFSTFIIMVAFMLLGVQVSVKFAGSVAPGSEKLLSILKSGGAAGIGVAGIMAAGKMAGKATAATARTTGRVALGGAKLAGKGAAFAGGEVLKRTDVAQKIAGELRKDKLVQTVLPERAQIAIGKFAGSHQERAKEKEATLGKIMSGMTATERDQYLENRMEQLKKNPMADISETMAVHSLSARNASTELYKEGLLKENREKAKAVLGENATAEDVEAKAKEMTYKTIGSRMQNAYDHAIATNNEDDLKKYQQIFEKNPNLMVDYDKQKELLADIASNPALQNKVADDSFTDAFTAWNYMKERKWVDDDGRLQAGVTANKDYQDFMRGRQGNLMRGHLEYAKTEQGKAKVQAILKPQRDKDGKIDVKSMNNNNYNISLSKDGKEFHTVPKNEEAPASERYHARFDKTTTDPAKIFSDEGLRNRADQLMPALGANAKLEQIGTELSKPAQAEFVRDLETLKQHQDSGDADKYNDKRDEIAKKYLAQGASSEALLDRDKETGDFKSMAGAESFERIMEGFLDDIKNNSLTPNDMASFTRMLEQVGTKGQAGEKAMEMIAKKMQKGEINQTQLFSLMRSGSVEQQKSIRQAFAEYAHKAQKDDDMLQKDTTAQILRQELQKQPPKGDTPEARAAIEDARKLRNIITHGKENP